MIQVTSNTLQYECIYGKDVMYYFDTIASMRINAFKDFPYLYLGTLKEERSMLQKFCQSKGAFLVLAKDQDKICGIATALPLEQTYDECQKSMKDAGYDIDSLYYLSEIILDKGYRSHGHSKQLFQLCEQQALVAGFNQITLMCVVRNKSDSRMPEHYRPLGDLFKSYGYQSLNNVTCQFEWPESPSGSISKNTLSFWIKSL